ncbi:Elongation factor Ts [Morus notabilis]|uniref:Elongation factor Ts, mitochondrial n=1 Tax=Morus notabilis TaxID=981085 RepID=W9SL34_9ROSA|nr:uncharacterized protein LOC21387179 [Morus notabilis]EXC15866.1 Elongation factor Ts [Morus notabilis]
MTPVIPYSISNVSLIPGTVFRTRKTYCSTRFSLSRKSTINTRSPQSFLLPRSASFGLLTPYGRGCSLHNQSRIYLLSATGTDVAVEEPDSPVTGEDSAGDSEVSSDAAEVKSDVTPTPATPKRSRPVKKSEMPPVKNEELVPGATFTGKVRSVQPFGAFIDFGAFTDGLVHVSRLSDSFVKDVGSVVSVGQEVKVRLVEANTETGRISLSMRESDDVDKAQQRKDTSASNDRAGPGRRNAPKSSQRKAEAKKVSKFVQGQDLEGTVKNMNRAGAFISLPEGEEGFLPIAEELSDGFGNVMGETSLEVGQEVSVRVLRISRGQVTLTMKKAEDIPKSDVQITQGILHTATNPFVLAFRKNKDIAAFLDDRENIEEVAEKPVTPKVSEEVEKEVSETVADCLTEQDQPVSSDETTVGVTSAVDEKVETDEASSEKAEASALEDPITEEASSVDEAESEEKPDSSAESAEPILSLETSTAEEVSKEQADDATTVKDDLQIETPTSESDVSSSSPTENKVEPDSDGNGNITSSDDGSQGIAEDQASSPESPAVEDINNVADDKKDDVQIETHVGETKIPSASKVEDTNAGVISDKNGSVPDSNDQTSVPSSNENVTKATISPALVKQLREETGAGMMDCKKALSETGGDIVKAQEYLRKKGLASAEKKASRATAEGRIGSYIHDSRIGVLVEVNCETDFVSRGDIFKELVEDLAMQVAACPQVQYLSTEDVPEEIVNKEREIEMQKEDLLSKPEQIRAKIVEGRIKKRLDELALLEQPYIKNDKVVIKDWVKQTIATIGENIKVKRFVRYNLGEGLEKKSQDFAAEVAAQTAAKPVPKEQPAVVEEAKETVEKSPTVTVSAALVKQLREETGAGMMDCKKALSETGGDIEKAQEYLRKKGLSSAEKKSSRLAAEGRIGSYIHDARIGVLLEVNCETDFVGRSENFKELVDDLAMQVVAGPQVQYVSVEDVPEDIVKKEKELELQREDLKSKPENIRERIVEGRVSKRLGELALLEQPYIKNDSILVKDLVKQTVAALGENIKVRRFVRFTLGETVENAEGVSEA